MLKNIHKLAGAALLSVALSTGTANAGEVQGEGDIEAALESGKLESSCNGEENISLLKVALPFIRNQRRFFARQTRKSLQGKCGHKAPLIHSLLQEGSNRWFVKTMKDLWIEVDTPEEVVAQIEQIVSLIEITLEEVGEVKIGVEDVEEYKIACVEKAVDGCRGRVRQMTHKEMREAVRIALGT